MPQVSLQYCCDVRLRACVHVCCLFRVVWAGTDTSPTWRGYLDGAVSTGRSAATRMARSQRPY